MESERKIEIEMADGRIVRVMKHMLDDAALFGASTMKKPIKNPPKELLITRESGNRLPEMIIKPLPQSKTEIELVREKLTEQGVKFHPNTGLDKLKSKLKKDG